MTSRSITHLTKSASSTALTGRVFFLISHCCWRVRLILVRSALYIDQFDRAMNSDLARVALLLRSLNAISMVGGFNPICLSRKYAYSMRMRLWQTLEKTHYNNCAHMHALPESTYPTDALTMPTCNTDKLVLAWNIKQPVYEMGLQYTCINPSGVSNESARHRLHGYLIPSKLMYRMSIHYQILSRCTRYLRPCKLRSSRWV